MLPLPMAPGECSITMNDSPSSVTPSLAPLSMRSVTAALQSPSVGRAARLDQMHGHSSVQLHVSMYSPLICQPAMAILLRGAVDLGSVRPARGASWSLL